MHARTYMRTYSTSVTFQKTNPFKELAGRAASKLAPRGPIYCRDSDLKRRMSCIIYIRIYIIAVYVERYHTYNKYVSAKNVFLVDNRQNSCVRQSSLLDFRASALLFWKKTSSRSWRRPFLECKRRRLTHLDFYWTSSSGPKMQAVISRGKTTV